MVIKSVFQIWLVLLFVVAFVSIGSAQVVVVKSKVTTNIADPILAGVETSIGVNRKLLVTVSWEGSNQITGISYGSQSLTEAVTAAYGRNASIWYLDAPQFGSHDVEVTFDVATDAVIAALSLEQAASGPLEQTASVAAVLTGDLSSSANALVLGVYTENGGGALSSNFANTLYSGASGSCVSDAGYQVESVAGVKSYTWSAANNSSVIALASVAYEPSAVTLDPLAIDAILGQTLDRQREGLASTLDVPKAEGISFVMGAYGLDNRNSEADTYLLTMQDEFQANNYLDFHWMGYQLQRIYWLYSSQSTIDQERMSTAAETAVLEMLWEWVSADCKIGMADPAHINYLWESENHHIMAWVTYWGAAQIFASHPVYSTYTYIDGSTPAQMAAEFDAYFKAWFRDRSSKNLLVEVASPIYAKYSLNALFNLVDFATDLELKAASSSYLDIYFAEWALEQIDGVRGGSRHRCYPGYYSVHPGGGAEHAWYLFGLGEGPNTHFGVLSALTTFWRPSPATVGLALDTLGRGSYSYTSRPLGLRDQSSFQENPNVYGKGPGYILDPDGGRLLRTTWCTPDFMMGMSQMEARSQSDWTRISSQNRWNGVIFGGNSTARIFTQRPDPASGSVYNAEWGVQHKGAMILQRLSRHKYATGQMVWFDNSLSRQESNGWIFAEGPRAYAAVKILDGGWSWDGVNWAVLNNQYSPIILEVGRKQDYSDMAAFQDEILDNVLVWDGTQLDYTSAGYDTTLTLFANESAPPQIDGNSIDYASKKAYDSPYLEGKFGSGPVIISYGDDRTVHGIAPFADDSDTQALWHFDKLASGTYYIDDTSNTGRSALNAVVHADSIAGITEIADGKFGKAIRCEAVEGDQFMMLGSSLWPAALGSFRYQGWIRLNPGDTGGYLCHVYDQVYLSVTTSTLTFRINRSGDVQDSSAVNQIELSALIRDSNDWQYIEAVYDGERIKLVTEVETVSAPGIGLFVPDKRNVYIGSRKNKNNYEGDMDEVKLSAAPATVFFDNDVDGMADTWEIQNFGKLGASDGTADADYDGFSDAEEFSAGTDPWDSASRFAISTMTAESISWQAVQGKTYRVLSTEDLTQPWGVVASGLQGDPPESSYFFDTDSEQKFFKIEVE